MYRKDEQMYLKFFGAVFIIIGCGGFGFRLAAMHHREEKSLRDFISVLDFMECELQYRHAPLPDLCRQASLECKGTLHDVFAVLSQELDNQIAPNVSICMNAVLAKVKNIPVNTYQMLELLGRHLGKSDVDGQLKGLDYVRMESRRFLDGLTKNKDVRIKSYQTLGLCTGAALAILFV